MGWGWGDIGVQSGRGEVVYRGGRVKEGRGGIPEGEGVREGRTRRGRQSYKEARAEKENHRERGRHGGRENAMEGGGGVTEGEGDEMKRGNQRGSGEDMEER